MNAPQAPQTPKKPRRPRLLHLQDAHYLSFFNGVRQQCELGLHICQEERGREEEREELYETLYRQICARIQRFEDHFLKAVKERRREVAEYDATHATPTITQDDATRI